MLLELWKYIIIIIIIIIRGTNEKHVGSEKIHKESKALERAHVKGQPDQKKGDRYKPNEEP